MNHDRGSSRILLTGAQGQVGWELLRSLRSLGEVVPTVHRASKSMGLDQAKSLDLGDESALRSLVREVRPTLIVNAAAFTAVDRAEQEPELAAAVNARAPGVLADEAKRLGAGIVHFSTDYVFDGSGTRPWKEDDVPAPLNVYGRTKLEGEHNVAQAGAPYWIFRTSWVYGVRGQNFVKSMLRLGCARDELAVVADQVGAPTSARAIAAATAQALASKGASPSELAAHSGIYHLSCQGETSWHGFAEAIFVRARQFKMPLRVGRVRPIRTEEYPTPAVRPANSRLDGRRFAQTFGLNLPDWQTALADSIEMLILQWQAEQIQE